MSNTHLLAGLVIVVAALSGCTGTTNPAEAGLFDNIRNLNSGEYDRQIAAKEAEAAAITRSNASMQAGINAMETQTQANASSIASLKAELASLRAEAAAARAKVGSDPVRAGKLDRLDSQIAAMQADVSGSGDPAALRAEMARTRAAIRALAN
jgi:serine phosphatase RsbU (regulator of sigma subunit)